MSSGSVQAHVPYSRNTPGDHRAPRRARAKVATTTRTSVFTDQAARPRILRGQALRGDDCGRGDPSPCDRRGGYVVAALVVAHRRPLAGAKRSPTGPPTRRRMFEPGPDGGRAPRPRAGRSPPLAIPRPPPRSPAFTKRSARPALRRIARRASRPFALLTSQAGHEPTGVVDGVAPPSRLPPPGASLPVYLANTRLLSSGPRSHSARAHSLALRPLRSTAAGFLASQRSRSGGRRGRSPALHEAMSGVP